MGGSVVRATLTVSNSSSCAISPRLLLVEKLLAPSSSAYPTSPHSTFWSRAHIGLPPCPFSPLLKSSASHHSPTRSSLSSASPSPCFSASLPSFPASFSASCRPGGSLMSSRLAPGYSSFCGVARLESLILASSGSRRRQHRGPKGSLGPGSNVKSSVEIRSISSGLSDCCWREGRGGGKARSIGCMENERNGQTMECYSSRSFCRAAAAGGGSDQSTSSSVLPPLPATPAKVKGLAISFCPRCGGATEEKIPVGEHEKRYVCTVCGAVHYQNPKMVVGCLVEHEGQILLCKRNIEPSFGLWTLPAGYMEMGESAAEGAARETLEEACAHVQVVGLFAHLDIPFIGQSHIYFRAQMKDPHFAPGPESIECALFKLNEIPFDSLAFATIQLALKMYVEDTEAGRMRVHHAVIDKRPGASPSDLKGFAVRDVLTN